MKNNSNGGGKLCGAVFCRHCGRLVTEDICAMKYGDRALCDTCIPEITIDELIRICEAKNVCEFLLNIGFTRI